MPNIDFETTTIGNAITTAEPNVDVAYGTITAVADSGVRGSNAMELSLSAFNCVRQDITPSANAFSRFYFRTGSTPASNSSIAEARDGTTVMAGMQLSTSRQIRIRNGFSLVDTSTTALTVDTWYRIEWNVNRTAGTQTCRIYDGPHSTTILETITGACTNGATCDRWIIGATAAGAATTVRYDDVDNSTSTWVGASASAGTDGAATYGLTITNSSDTATIADRTYEIDATGSTGTVTLAWDGTSRGTITESPTGVFTIDDPDDGTDPLLLVLTAAGSGGGADDDLGISIPRGGSSTRSVLVYDGTATVGNIDNWG